MAGVDDKNKGEKIKTNIRVENEKKNDESENEYTFTSSELFIYFWLKIDFC